MRPEHIAATARGARFEDWVRYRVARRGAFPFLAGAIMTLALGAGVLARLIAPEDFDSMGDAVWWALATLTTVGYGDVVPAHVPGRLIGAFVMVLGVTFISLLTANVTSLFVSTEENAREVLRAQRENELRAALQRVEERLHAIEARLSEPER